MKKFPIVILISGRGSNLKAIIDAKDPLIEIKAVISNKSQAGGLLYAKQNNIKTEVLNHKNFKTRLEFDQALQICIDKYQPELIVLAGFMRILSAEFVNHYQKRIINIHPSLLPTFKGLHTHKRVLEAKIKQHGASVHFLTEELDAGPVIIQAQVPVFSDDNEDTLAARVLNEEHRIYPQAIHWFAEGRLKLRGQQVFLDNQIIEVPNETF
ncbi:phosphoribosylglycinamide formyltransferase [Candidatus Halobeggiatoa sp. HSG11]|nr:phosphoribosylglycinamide formyltransferase [Candidatus Halobeggiatoa sp. HSG11]